MKEGKMKKPRCAQCKSKPCKQGTTNEKTLPAFCPMIHYRDLVKEVKKKYSSSDIHHFYLMSARTEKDSYDTQAAREQNRTVPVRPRIREIAAFAEAIDAHKIGIAFCVGLADEAARACSILEGHGLDISSVVCCCGAVEKTDLGIPKKLKIRDPEKFEAACNPLLQAEILNQRGTDFNLLIGLCVGHDMLFTKTSLAPVTTLIVKDRLTGHNPVITLYSRYHKDVV
jgi:uncharacterized metal-binding protein